VLLDDQSGVYWTTAEKQYAVWEGLKIMGAYGNYWRARGEFNLTVGQSFYDLSTVLPTLRPRTWTLNQLTQDIQYACLEAANGISGVGMSGQISVGSILQAIARARNQFVLDAHLPLSLLSLPTPPSPTGTVVFDQSTVFLHRVSWQDGFTSQFTNLWREDAWAIDHADPYWTTTPAQPSKYSESELSPLILQLAPAPLSTGVLEALAVLSVTINLTNPNALLQIPDEWVHAIKYAALSDIFGAESQNADPLRAKYAEMRYQQAIDAAMSARSVFRLLYGGVPLPIDSLAAIDAAQPYWRNQAGPPQMAGVLYDYLAFNPGSPDSDYGITADVVQSAPLPTPSGFIQLGEEDIDRLLDYATHIMTFKCGGKEFQSTFAQYDSFMQAVATRGAINKAKIRYLTSLLGQPQKEEGERPDQLSKEALRSATAAAAQAQSVQTQQQQR
jgi:hypothetical protein